MLRTKNYACDVFSGHSVTSLLYNSTYVASDITVLGRGRWNAARNREISLEGCRKLREYFVLVFPFQVLEKMVDKPKPWCTG